MQLLLELEGGAVGSAEASKIATGANDELLLEVRGDKGALIASMAVDIGIAANILGASTRTVGKREYGYMLIEIPGGPDELAKTLKYISKVPDVVVQVEAQYSGKEAGEV